MESKEKCRESKTTIQKRSKREAKMAPNQAKSPKEQTKKLWRNHFLPLKQNDLYMHAPKFLKNDNPRSSKESRVFSHNWNRGWASIKAPSISFLPNSPNGSNKGSAATKFSSLGSKSEFPGFKKLQNGLREDPATIKQVNGQYPKRLHHLAIKQKVINCWKALGLGIDEDHFVMMKVIYSEDVASEN